ncbi:MAG: hypothetical protein IJ111_02740 [Eggerthellaceae bacterium]|nr:hypothetical protein [Eggerthellaceae bacterium]
MSKAAQRQANYRAFCEKQMAHLRTSLAERTPEDLESYLADFQTRLDEMFTRIPGIADDEANFDNACKHIAYQIAMESDELTDEQKAQFTEQRMQQLGNTRKNWAAIIVVIIVIVAVVLLISQLPKLL